MTPKTGTQQPVEILAVSRVHSRISLFLLWPGPSLLPSGHVFFFNWRVITLRCGVPFCCPAAWISCVHPCISSLLSLLPTPSHPSGSLPKQPFVQEVWTTGKAAGDLWWVQDRFFVPKDAARVSWSHSRPLPWSQKALPLLQPGGRAEDCSPCGRRACSLRPVSAGSHFITIIVYIPGVVGSVTV